MADDLKPDEKNGGDAAKAGQKVELDLDDAPFLDDEPEPEPEPEKEPEKEPEESESAIDDTPPQSFLQRLLANKKKLIMAGGAGVALILVAVVVNIFLFSGDPKPPPPPPVEAPAVQTEVQVVPPKKPDEAVPPPRFLLQFDRFWVEMKDTEGASRFLTLRFCIPTEKEILFVEMNAKMLILRDAIFYYLRSESAISLSDEKKADAFKSDIMTVINEHVGSGKVSEILIQEYLLE